MRRRSGTNSRPLENIPLRRAYLVDHPWCEFKTWFPQHFNDPDAIEVHHVHSARSRADLITNFIAISRDAHEWVERYKTDGRVLAVLIKVYKSEFDPDEFKAASGMYIAGFAARAECSHDWVRPYLDELRSWCDGRMP